MRYIRQELVVRPISDQKIDSLDDIKLILSKLKEKQICCAIKLKNGPEMSMVKILQIGENDLKYVMINGLNILRKSSLYEDIECLTVSTSDAELCFNNPNITRWDLISPV